MFSYIFPINIIKTFIEEFTPSSKTKADITEALSNLNIGIYSSDILYIPIIKKEEKKEEQEQKQKTE